MLAKGWKGLCTTCDRRITGKTRNCVFDATIGMYRPYCERCGRKARFARDAIQRRAHREFQLAIKEGRLIRQPCLRCGDEASEGHHEDYSMPLHVMWLCRKHHKERHREVNAQRRTKSEPFGQIANNIKLTQTTKSA